MKFIHHLHQLTVVFCNVRTFRLTHNTNPHVSNKLHEVEKKPTHKLNNSIILIQRTYPKNFIPDVSLESRTGIFTSFSAGIPNLQYEYTNLDTSKIATHLPNLFEAISSFGGLAPHARRPRALLRNSRTQDSAVSHRPQLPCLDQ